MNKFKSNSPIPHSMPCIEHYDINSINTVLKTRMICSSDKAIQFKKQFSELIQKDYVILSPSGQAALFSILTGLNLHKPSEILIPSYICGDVKNAIIMSGHIPVFYDLKQRHWISDYDEINKKVSSKTKAVIVNHTFGIAFSDKRILDLKKRGILLIEDCAHRIGIKNRHIEISYKFDVSFYSFNATKLLTTGEGGAIATNHYELYHQIISNTPEFKMSDIAASLGLSQLKRYPEFLKIREEIATYYLDNLKDIANEISNSDSIYFRFPIFVPDDRPYLSSKNVSFRKGVDALLHNPKKEKLPNTEFVFKHTICLPIYPALKVKERKIIVNETKKIFNESQNIRG